MHGFWKTPRLFRDSLLVKIIFERAIPPTCHQLNSGWASVHKDTVEYGGRPSINSIWNPPREFRNQLKIIIYVGHHEQSQNPNPVLTHHHHAADSGLNVKATTPSSATSSNNWESPDRVWNYSSKSSLEIIWAKETCIPTKMITFCDRRWNTGLSLFPDCPPTIIFTTFIRFWIFSWG